MNDADTAVADAKWRANVVYGDSPPDARVAKLVATDTHPAAVEGPDTSDPVSLETSDSDVVTRHPHDPDRRGKRVAGVLGAGLVGTVALIVGLLLCSGPSDALPELGSPTPAVAAAPTPPPAVMPPTPAQDQAIAFTASADCPAGSTSAQTLTDTTRDSAWVCVRGPAGAAVDGQVLHVDFGTSHVVTAVTVTPGWVAKTAGGQEEWLQHRVVSRLQYMFNDDARTIITQDTGNAHGPVTLPLPRPVLASQVTVIILQTARPPASPVPSADPAVVPGFFDVAPTGTGSSAPETSPADDPITVGDPNGDPVDATFAMSTLQFFGHPPT